MKSAHTLTTIATVLILTTLAAAEVTFTDGEFAPADWELTLREDYNGGTVGAQQELTGGSPDEYRRVTTNVQADSPYPFARVYAFNKAVNASWDPATQGAIESIDYAEESVLFGSCGNGVHTGPAVFQDGKAFILADAMYDIHPMYANTSYWQSESAGGLVADNWVLNWENEDIHPDFSESGSPIAFGFYRLLVTTDVAYGCDSGIDNWSLTVHPVPEPTCLGLLSAGLVALVRRRHD